MHFSIVTFVRNNIRDVHLVVEAVSIYLGKDGITVVSSLGCCHVRLFFPDNNDMLIVIVVSPLLCIDFFSMVFILIGEYKLVSG